MPKPQMTLDAMQARALAEYASSLRGEGGDPLFMVTDENTETGKRHVHPEQSHNPCNTALDVVLPVSTAYVQPNRPAVVEIQIQADGMKDPETLMQYDAVFWSESAVEKFILPYYASKYAWSAAYLLEVLSCQFYGFVPGPDGKPARTCSPVQGTETLEAEESPFAVAHLPRSDYIPLSSTDATPEQIRSIIGSEVWLLVREKKTGKVVHRPLSYYL